MFTLDSSLMSATVGHGNTVEVRRQNARAGAAPYNPSALAPKVRALHAQNSPVRVHPLVAKRNEPAPFPLPPDPAVRAVPTHATAQTNSALPPPPDKTTAPRTVDPSGTPLARDPAGQPSVMSDVPVTPPPATSDRDPPNAAGGRAGNAIPPAPPPRKTTKTPRNENRASAPAPPVPPPGPDNSRSPWNGGANGVP
jgi:hypothetical protein